MAQPLEDARAARLGLCVLCGLPGAGKTTVAQALGHLLRRRFGWKCLLLSYDHLIPLEAFSQWESSAGQMSQWKLHRHELLFYLEHFLQTFIKGNHYCPPPNRIETIWKSFVGCLKAQELISAPVGTDDWASCQYLIDFSILRPIYFILDDNFYYRSMRYEVYQLARQYNLGFCQLFLDCQIEICLERNGQRKEPLPEEIIYAMLQKIEAPNPEKYMWEQNSLILNSAEFTLEDNLQVFDLLSTALENPVKPLEENTKLKEMDRTICATSILHQADQTIRQAVSQAMKNAKDSNLSPSAMKNLAEELSKLKMEFLEDLRHKANGKQQFLQNNTFEKCITTAFNQKSDDIVKKYLNS